MCPHGFRKCHKLWVQRRCEVCRRDGNCQKRRVAKRVLFRHEPTTYQSGGVEQCDCKEEIRIRGPCHRPCVPQDWTTEQLGSRQWHLLNHFIRPRATKQLNVTYTMTRLVSKETATRKSYRRPAHVKIRVSIEVLGTEEQHQKPPTHITHSHLSSLWWLANSSSNNIVSASDTKGEKSSRVPKTTTAASAASDLLTF